MQQCATCSLDIVLGSKPVLLLQLASFQLWLPRYAGLVRSLTLNDKQMPNLSAANIAAYWKLVCGMLRSAMRQTAAPPAEVNLAADVTAATAAASKAHAATAHPQQQLQQPQQQQQQRQVWRLAHFRSDAPYAWHLLDHLPACSLTGLDLSINRSISDRLGAAISAALARLSRLQRLSLSCRVAPGILHTNCLAGIQQLSRLTSLSISGCWRSYPRPRQQPTPQLLHLGQLTQQLLQLRQLHLDCSGLPAIDLAHLTQLDRLVLKKQLPHGSRLPLQLTALELDNGEGDLDVVLLLRLQRLRRLHIAVEGFDSAPQLLQLARALPALTHLSLEYCHHHCDSGETQRAVEVWPRLPSLQELNVGFGMWTPSPIELSNILRGVAGCTRLTQLQLAAMSVLEDEDGDPFGLGGPVAACACLAGLSNLRSSAYPRPVAGVQCLHLVTHLP